MMHASQHSSSRLVYHVVVTQYQYSIMGFGEWWNEHLHSQFIRESTYYHCSIIAMLSQQCLLYGISWGYHKKFHICYKNKGLYIVVSIFLSPRISNGYETAAKHLGALRMSGDQFSVLTVATDLKIDFVWSAIAIIVEV